MIPFEEIDRRLDALGLDRAWLAETTGRKINSIRVALAPNSDPKNRSELLQRVLSDAIEKEEEQRKKAPVLPDRITLEVDSARFDAFSKAAAATGLPLKEWMIYAMGKEARREMDSKSFVPKIVASESSEAGSRVAWLDLVAGVAAGAPISSHVVAEPIEVSKQYPDGCYALKVFGESMAPKIPDGSVIVVKPWDRTRTPRKRSIVVYSDASGSTLKEYGYRAATPADDPEIINSVGKVAVLRSLNPAFPDVQTMEGGRIDAVLVEVLSRE